METKYPGVIRILHWLMALLIIGMLAVGLYMTSLPREDALRPMLYGWHKSFGVIVLVLFFIRIAIRVSSVIPALPGGMKAWEVAAAKASHHLLYILMFAMPFTGYLMSDSVGFGVKFFGVQLPKIFPTDRPVAQWAADAHALLAYLLIGIIALHVAGALKHVVIDRYNIFKRII